MAAPVPTTARDKSQPLRVIKQARSLPHANVEEHYTWSIAAASNNDSERPVAVGFWGGNSSDNTADENEDDIYVAEYDEAKYIVSGTIEVEDVTLGQKYTATSGDLLWIPRGSKSRVISCSQVEAFYVDQLPSENGAKPVTDDVDEAQNAEAALSVRESTLTAQMVATNPESQRIHNEASKVMPGGNTRSVLHGVPFPVSFSSGSGVKVTSVDGREYIDCVSEYSAAMFGHSHPALQEAIQAAAKDGFNLGGPTQWESGLAKHLCSRFKSLELVRFCNSGTEANSMCLVAALAHTGRKKILVFDNGYHGGTLSFHTRTNPANLPHDFVYGTYNDVEATKSKIDGDLAAILVEPMLGAGGLVPATREFLSFLRESATRVGAVLIFDEVMTSRLAIGGLQGHLGIYPDMTSLGKYLGGGFSFGAFGGHSSIMRRFDPNSPDYIAHSGTFNNNVFSMRAGLAAAKILTEDAIAQANSLGDHLRDSIRSLASREHVSGLEVTGFGSMVGLHYSGPHANAIRRCVFLSLLESGIYIGQRGFIALNICHRQEHIDEVVRAFEMVLQDLGKDFRSQGSKEPSA